jgi:hypothetical protein
MELQKSEDAALRDANQLKNINTDLGKKTREIIHEFAPLNSTDHSKIAISGFDPRVFENTYGDKFASLAREIVARVFGTDTTPEGRERAIREIQDMLRNPSELAKKGFQETVSKERFHSDRNLGAYVSEVTAFEGESERITSIEEGIRRGLLAKDPGLQNILEMEEAKRIIKERAELLYKQIENIPTPEIEHEFKIFLGDIRFGQNGMPSKQEAIQAKDPNFLSNKITEQAKGGSPKFQKYLAGNTFKTAIEGCIQALMNKEAPNPSDADPNNAVSGTNNIQTPLNPSQTPSQPTTTVVPATQGQEKKSETPSIPPETVPTNVDFKIRITGEDTNTSCLITINIPSISYDYSRQLSRASKAEFQAGVKEVINEMDRKLPELLDKLQLITEGGKAEFKVMIYTYGEMLPMSTPAWLAKDFKMFFDNQHKNNQLIDPIFDQWHDENNNKVYPLTELLKN